MRINVHFNNMKKSEAVNSFIQTSLNEIFTKYQIQNPEADVYLNIIRARTEYRHPLFSCEILIKNDFDKNFHKVLKKESDLYKAIGLGIKAVNLNLSKHSTRKNDHHRYERRAENNY